MRNIARARALAGAMLLWSTACSFDPVPAPTAFPDLGPPDAAGREASTADARPATDAGAGPDGGTEADARAPDVGPGPDSGASDSGPADGGAPDAGFPDAEFPDAGFPDAGFPDAGFPDAGPPNRDPVAVDDSAQTTAGTPVIIPVLANDSDPDQDVLFVQSVSPPSAGMALVANGGDSVEFTPATGFIGTTSFTYTAADGRGGSATASVGVTVQPQPLSIQPAQSSSNVNSRLAFTASGGITPYSFSASSGRIDPNTGAYFSPPAPALVTVQATDAAGSAVTATITVGDGDLYLLGGVDDLGDTSAVRRSQNGGLTWARPSNLPSAVYLHDAVVFEDQIWVVGGRGFNVSAFDAVITSSDGSTWTTVGALPYPARGGHLEVFQERLFFMGGRDDNDDYRDEVYSSPDGVSWTLEGQLPDERAYGSTIVYDDRLWLIGGDDDDGFRSSVWATSDGVSWASVGNLPGPRIYGELVVRDGEMWFLGGSDDANSAEDEVWSSSDGITWVARLSLPARRGGGSAINRGPLGYLGGASSFNSTVPEDDILILPAGGGTWVVPRTLPVDLAWHRLVVFAP